MTARRLLHFALLRSARVVAGERVSVLRFLREALSFLAVVFAEEEVLAAVYRDLYWKSVVCNLRRLSNWKFGN
jgi:hypothetical protein